MICASQFLLKKGSSNYDDDECTFMTSILELPGPKTARKPGWEDSDDRVLQISLPLSQMDDLDDLEAAAFHFLCGYTIKTLQNLCKTCDDCFNMLKLDRSLAPTTEDEQLPDLLTYKRDFTGDALIYPSKLAFDTLMVCEKVVRDLQRNGKFYLGTVALKDELLDQFISHTRSFDYMNCHEIKRKLLSRFAVIRLRLIGRVLHKDYEKRVGDNDGSLGSRSMAMRKHVDTLRITASKK